MMDWPACSLRVSIRWMMEPVMTPAFDYAVARENNVGYTYNSPNWKPHFHALHLTAQPASQLHQ